jgi:DNA-binding NarL/FixJ family response regulator
MKTPGPSSRGVRPERSLPVLSELSPRQASIVELAARGLTNAAIAARLNSTPGTARTHPRNAYAAQGGTNRRRFGDLLYWYGEESGV